MATKKKKLGTEFTKTILPKRQAVAPVGAGIPETEDPLATIKNVASIAASLKGGAIPPSQTAPIPQDVATTPIAGADPAGLGIEQPPVPSDSAVSGPFKVFNAQGKEVGVKGPTLEPEVQPRQTAPSPTAQPVSREVFDASGKIIGTKSPTSQGVIPLAKAEPAIGVGETVGPVPATPEEVDTKIEELKVKKPGFFEGLGEEGQQALIRAALSAGTSILEANDPFGAAAIISRGVQTGFETADKIRGAQAKGKAAKRAETRTVAGEKREETKLGLEERRVKVAERAKPVKESETAEGRIKKAEGDAAKAADKDGLGIEESVARIKKAGDLQAVIEKQAEVSPGIPEERTGGFFGVGQTITPGTGTPTTIKRFPSRTSKAVQDVKRGVEARRTVSPSASSTAIVNKIRSLLAAGTDPAAITRDLLARGIDPTPFGL